MSPRAGCSHCGRELDVSQQTLEAAEEFAGGTICCGACEGMHELPEDLPECDFQDCEDPAPFSIETEAGAVRRCRVHLIQDLRRGWHTFYSEPEMSEE